MWQAEFLAVKRFIDDMRIDPTQGKAIEVGGGPIVVVDDKPQDNPLLSLSPQVTFLDEGFITRYGKPPHILADFMSWSEISHLAGSFDLVYSFQTMEHVNNPFLFVRHLVAITKPGGAIFLTTVFSFAYHPSPSDYWRFSPQGLQELFKQAGDNMLLWAGFGPNQGGVIAVAQRTPATYWAYPTKLRFEEVLGKL